LKRDSADEVEEFQQRRFYPEQPGGKSVACQAMPKGEAQEEEQIAKGF